MTALDPKDYDQMIDDAFAFRSKRLLAKIKGGHMQFKIIVIQVRRLVVLAEADSREVARAKWENGQRVSESVVESEVIYVEKAA